MKAPEITMDIVDTMQKDEISEIIKEYLIRSQLIEYFEFNGEFYADFHEGILNFIKTRFETTQEIMNKLLMPNAIKAFINNTFPVSTDLDIIEDVSQNIMTIVEPQQKIWEEWAEKNEKLKEIHEKNQKYLEEALEKYNLTKKEAFDHLKRYHWIISPNIDKKFVYDVVKIFNSETNNKRQKINFLFNDYFFDNECKNLYELLEIWKSKIRFNNRITIIKNCIDVIKYMGDSFNFSNVVVPTLITQIEGVQMNFMEENFHKVDNEGAIWITENTKLRDEHNSKIKLNSYLKSLVKGDEFLEAMNWLFLDILFQKTYPGEPYSEPIHFSRNKILHGENTKYGRKDYTSRCFLILDFLSELSHHDE